MVFYKKFSTLKLIYNKAACKGPCALVTPKKMNHFQFDFYEDFTNPLKIFLDQCGIYLHLNEKKSPVFPDEAFINPY